MQDMIESRGNRAGRQIVKEATQRAEREEQLMREAETQKGRQDAEKVDLHRAQLEQVQREVAASRSAQLALKKQQQDQDKAEVELFVADVCTCPLNCPCSDAAADTQLS
jgi:hypothetical protein